MNINCNLSKIAKILNYYNFNKLYSKIYLIVVLAKKKLDIK